MPPTVRICPRCRLEKPHSEFHRNATTKDGCSVYCKDCVREYQRAYRKENAAKVAARRRAEFLRNPEAQRERQRRYVKKDPDAYRAYFRNWHLKRKYNLTSAEWDALLAAQGNRCAICGDTEPRTKQGWHTDHCHNRGHVRGILCHHCNLALAHIKDSPEIALKLYSYLSGKLPFAP